MIAAMEIGERETPPFNGDERTTLAAWLDFQRHTLVLKCEGLDDTTLRTASAPPSSLTLQGLVQHLAEVERNWFQRVLGRRDAPPIYGPAPAPGGHDGGRPGRRKRHGRPGAVLKLRSKNLIASPLKLR